MTMLNDNLLNALKSAKPKELKFVASVLDRSIKKGISIFEAAKIEKYQPGSKVTFLDSRGTEHVAVVEKLMTKRVRVFDKTAKTIVNIYPQQLKAYIPKVYAPRAKPSKVVTGIGQTITIPAPRVKRKYVRKAKPLVDLTPLLKKYGKENQFSLDNPRQKRKYVRKVSQNVTQ